MWKMYAIYAVVLGVQLMLSARWWQISLEMEYIEITKFSQDITTLVYPNKPKFYITKKSSLNEVEEIEGDQKL